MKKISIKKDREIMKNQKLILIIFFSLIITIIFIFFGCKKTNNNTIDKLQIMNKPLITHIYTADPSAHVFVDKIYISFT